MKTPEQILREVFNISEYTPIGDFINSMSEDGIIEAMNLYAKQFLN